MPCYLASIHRLGSGKQALWIGFLISSIIAIGGFHWIVFVSENFGGLPLPGALAMLFAYCIVAAPQVYAFFWLGFHFRFEVERLPLWLRPLFWAFLYVALEFIARQIKIFPEHLGNTMIGFLPLAQAASLGGVSLLSFVPLFLGATFFYLGKEKMRALPIFAASVFLLLILCIWGKSEMARVKKLPTHPLKISMLQANIGDMDKVVSESGNRQAIDTVINRYLNLATAHPEADLIIWPETAYPLAFPARASLGYSPYAQGYANLVMDRAKLLKKSMLLGGYEQEKGRDYNSALLVGADGKAQGSYRKVHLLIFGEWMPLANIFPKLKELNPQMGDFGEGEGAVPLQWTHDGTSTLLGITICYESLIPEYMRALAVRGADFFLNITNDSWFGPTFEPWQHLQLASLRTIENRKPMVRATNTGLSVVIDSTGKTITMGPLFEASAIQAEVAIPDKSNSPSVYLVVGELFAWMSIAISTLLLFTLWRRKT